MTRNFREAQITRNSKSDWRNILKSPENQGTIESDVNDSNQK